MGNLYFGDNLDVLREYIASESVDLIYMDPPFNSQARYNILFESPAEDRASAQVEAFRDTWTWGEEAETDFAEVMAIAGPTARFVQALRSVLGESDMMAYLTMMAVRLIELHRVLKPTGSLYLHCDPTASHYLKILLDSIFGAQNYQNEIVWQRYKRPKGSQHKARRFGRSTDSIFFYSKSDEHVFHLDQIRTPIDQETIERMYPHEDELGRYMSGPLLRSVSMGLRPNLVFDFMGYTPDPAGWRMTKDKLEQLHRSGDVYFTSNGIPRRKVRPSNEPSAAIDSLWTDIEALSAQAKERIGYPTQKPLTLLERIISASSNEGDVVLDPFCGCGTSVHAAQKLNREWIGIDIAYYAIRVIRRRMDEAGHEIADKDIKGLPRDLEQAQALADRDKYQFQWWANGIVGVQQFREIKKGADRGIDGEYYFLNGPRPVGRVLTSVKGGRNVSLDMVRAFRTTVDDEKADMGVFVCLGQPTKAMKDMAVSAGFTKTVHGQFPRLQIFSVEDYFDGKTPQLPPPLKVDENAFSTRRKRKKVVPPDPEQPQLMLPFSGSKDDKKAGIIRHLNPDALVAIE